MIILAPTYSTKIFIGQTAQQHALFPFVGECSISKLGFVTLIVGEISLGPLGNAHHLSLASIATNELVAG